MLVDTTRQRNLLTILGTSRSGELELSTISLDGDDLRTGGGGADVDHENFVLGELGDLCLLAVGSLDTEETAEEEVVDFEVGVDGGELAAETEDETDKTIGTAEGGVHTGTDTCKS